MTKRKKTKITSLNQFPDFDKMTLQEEAHWWETHDLSEVWEQMDEVELKVAPDAFKVPRHLRQMSSAINVRLDPIDHHHLRTIAGRKGIGIATLARMWIIEKLQERDRNENLRP